MIQHDVNHNVCCKGAGVTHQVKYIYLCFVCCYRLYRTQFMGINFESFEVNQERKFCCPGRTGSPVFPQVTGVHNYSGSILL